MTDLSSSTTTTSDLHPGNPDNPGHLTQRELEVMAMIGRGLSNAEIADRLYLSINTVKSHIRTAYRRVGISRRVDAVRWAMAHLRGMEIAASPGGDQRLA